MIDSESHIIETLESPKERAIDINVTTYKHESYDINIVQTRPAVL